MLDRIGNFFVKLPRRMRTASWIMTIFVVLFVLDPDLGKLGPTLEILLPAIPLAVLLWLVGRYAIKPVFRRMWRPFAMFGARIVARIAG